MSRSWHALLAQHLSEVKALLAAEQLAPAGDQPSRLTVVRAPEESW